MARKKMRKLNPTPGQILLGVGAVTLGLLAAGVAFAAEPKKTKKKAKKKTEPDPAEEEKRKARELLELVITPGDDPQDGALYSIQKGDNFANVVRRVFRNAGLPFDADTQKKYFDDYMRCVSSSEFNRTLFGNANDFNSNFPEYTSPDNISLRKAFLPQQANQLQRLTQGRLPQRGGGGKYALLWLPKIDVNAFNQFGEIACFEMEPPPLTAA